MNSWQSYGGLSGVRALAAAYAYGILRNHPFVDGNKRTAFVVMKLFLQLNGYELNVNDNEFVEIMPKVAAGTMQETVLIDWLKAKTTLRKNEQVEKESQPRAELRPGNSRQNRRIGLFCGWVMQIFAQNDRHICDSRRF